MRQANTTRKAGRLTEAVHASARHSLMAILGIVGMLMLGEEAHGSAISLRCVASAPNDASHCDLILDGEITQSSLTELISARELALSKGATVGVIELNSPGGDLSTALRMAEKLREWEFTASIEPAHACVSSCVLLIAGGVRRGIQGRVGIHRPYFVDGASSAEEARRTFSAVDARVKSFFMSGGVRASLWDEVLATPPEEVRFLTPLELRDFGLSRNDPAIDEVQARKTMQEFSITRTQYNERIALSKNCDGTVYFNLLQNDLSVEETSEIVRECHRQVMQTGRPTESEPCPIALAHTGPHGEEIYAFMCFVKK